MWRGPKSTGWGEELERALAGTAQHPAARALAEVHDQRPLPREAVTELLEGVAMDLEYGAYPGFRELSIYCHRVGGAPVRLAVAACGADTAASAQFAHDLGMALPLIRGLRRLRPQLESGHTLIPDDELEDAGLGHRDLLERPADPEVRAFLDTQAERIEAFLDSALANVPPGEAPRLLPMSAHAHLYRRLLARLRVEGMPVLQGRQHLTPLRKLWYAWRFSRRARRRGRGHTQGV
ncbi:MAG: squalene/phytoene synthase family protein [Arhodomonas sp.]|nr:squalene/phytoene synthase family protein [Arhodomonas sp.]